MLPSTLVDAYHALEAHESNCNNCHRERPCKVQPPLMAAVRAQIRAHEAKPAKKRRNAELCPKCDSASPWRCGCKNA